MSVKYRLFFKDGKSVTIKIKGHWEKASIPVFDGPPKEVARVKRWLYAGAFDAFGRGFEDGEGIMPMALMAAMEKRPRRFMWERVSGDFSGKQDSFLTGDMMS